MVVNRPRCATLGRERESTPAERHDFGEGAIKGRGNREKLGDQGIGRLAHLFALAMR